MVAHAADDRAEGEPHEARESGQEPDTEGRCLVVSDEEPARGGGPVAAGYGLFQEHRGRDLTTELGIAELRPEPAPVARVDPDVARSRGVVAAIGEGGGLAREGLGRLDRVAFPIRGAPEEMVGPRGGRVPTRDCRDGPAILAGVGVGEDEPPPAHQEHGVAPERGGGDDRVDTALVDGRPELGRCKLVVGLRHADSPRSEQTVVVVEQVDEQAHVVRVLGGEREI